LRVEVWEGRGEGRAGRDDGGGARVAKCGLRVQGYSRLSREEIANWGSEPELRHASVQRSAGVGGFRKIAGPVILVHPNKEAPSPVDRKRGGVKVMGCICLHEIPVHVVAGHLPYEGPAGGPTLSVRNILPDPAGRTPGVSLIFQTLRM